MSATLLDLMVKISADDGEFQKKIGGISGAFSKIGGFAKAAAGVTTAAVGAAATGIGVLTKSAVSGYSEYEQLIGGVQKLYGNMGKDLQTYAKDTGQSVDAARSEWQKLEDAQNLVANNAKQAFKTAGMNANEYMETATSFSASLINSLGGDTVKAAEQTDVAMRAISDNVNTFGSNMEDVTNAFKGFSKQNFTMLDNLKLGYGGTKEEMARLIKDANEWGKANGKASDLSIDSFSDVVTAIEQIQEKQNIAGTTAREAATTVEGSINMTKAAWENLLAGLANPDADISQLIDDLVGSATQTVTNLVPVVERALNGIVQLVDNIIPVIASNLPSLISTLLPTLITAAFNLVTGLVSALPGILRAVVQAVVTSVQSIATQVAGQGGSFLSAAQSLASNLLAGIQTALPQLVQKGISALQGFLDGITAALPGVLAKGVEIYTWLVNGIYSALPQMVATAGQVIVQFVTFVLQNLPSVMDAGAKMLLAEVNGIVNNLPAMAAAQGQVIGKLIATIVANLPAILAKGIEIVVKLAAGLIMAVPKVVSAVVTLIKNIVSGFGSYDWGSIGHNIIQGIANGIRNAVGVIVDAARNAAESAFNAAKSFLGIESPSKLMRDQVGKYISLGMAAGIDDYSDSAVRSMESMAQNVSDAATVSMQTSAGGSTGAMLGSYGPISINVYARENDSLTDLAERVSDVLGSAVNRRRAVFA